MLELLEAPGEMELRQQQLEIDRRHREFVVARARRLGHLGVDPREILVGQLDVEGRGALLQVGAALGAWNRHEILALGEHVGER
jgi:hypothetical protein